MAKEKVLEGIRVVELAMMQAGPYAATMLGDMGAEVIKIETHDLVCIDPMRRLQDLGGANVVLPNGRSAVFEDIDHSKKSMCLNLRKPEGIQIFYELITKSDVFVTNYREPALKRMHMDYQTLQKKNPRLIYAWSTTAGTRGPDRLMAGIDGVAQARTGIMMMSGLEGNPPSPVTFGLVDRATALSLVCGITSALYARERTKKGQLVHTSMLGAMTMLQGMHLSLLFMKGKSRKRWNIQTGYPLYNLFECKGGQWIMLGLFPADRYFPGVCEMLEIPEVLHDPRFADDMLRIQNAKQLNGILAEKFRTKTYEEWKPMLIKMDAIFGPIQTDEDLRNDPQMVENGYIRTWNHPVEGPIQYIGPLVDFSDMPMDIQSESPELGQHTEQILNEVLDYEWDQIGNLRDAGILL